jgi:hypothetical protein
MSSCIYDKANNHKQIILYEGATHGLEEAAKQVSQVVYPWLAEHSKKQLTTKTKHV